MATTSIVSGSSSRSWDLETNWRVAAGCLKRTVVFESSADDSPVDTPPPDSVNDAATPLVLKPKAADSGPCEIKIRFLQKYEIRQIYVRSTARVYEVYHAQSWESENEYLCTVRCSIAERDEQVLQAFDIKESAESAENSLVELKEEKLTDEGNIGISEDDWVEVKALDSSLEHSFDSLSNRKSASLGRDIQDFYEATVEISDLDPCISITLRFLSLQNKTCVCIDEVYVFGDPADAIDLDHQSQDVKGSAGSSLMAILVPTLLQLSKSGASNIEGRQASSDLQKGNKIATQSKVTDLTDLTSHQDEKGNGDQQYVKLQKVDGSTTEPAETQLCSASSGLQKGNKIETQSKATDLTDLISHQDEKGNGDQQFVKLQKVDGSTTEPAEPYLCNQILDGDRSDDPRVKNYSRGHIEKVLEQIVSRVGRIEEVCLRFEENMLKPLNSMETRIQRVEQQLEELVNNSQHSGLAPCTRIYAPSFSNSSSFHNDGSDYQPCRAPESEKELTSGDLFNASDGISSSANGPHRLPSLVVTAPDFSSEDDLDDGLKSLKNFPQENKNKSLIDDVLAASLSGFLSASTGNISVCKRDPFISHCTSEIVSDKVPSENAQAFSSGVEITTDVNAKEEPSRYTQVLMVMAPEFTFEENAAEELLDNAEFASVSFPKFTNKISESSNDVSLKGAENGCSVATSDLSDISRDMLVSSQASTASAVASAVFAEANSIIPDDVPPGMGDAQSHVSERSNRCSFMVTNVDDTGDEAEDVIRSDVYQTIMGSDKREPVTSLFAEKNDEFEQLSGHRTDGSPIAVGAAGSGTECVAVEGLDKEIQRNLSESSSASLIDFGIPILDVKFTPYEDSRTQLPLEALLDDEMDLNVETEPPQENGVEDAYARETNFIDINEEDETGDSLPGKSLVMDLGVYDMTFSSNEENVLDDSYSTWKQDTVVSLI